MRFEITKVWTSCLTAAAESACSNWMTDSIGSKLTSWRYFMATSLAWAIRRDDDGLHLLELDEFGMARLGVGQRPVLVAAVPGGDDRSVAARHLEQAQRLDLQGGVEQDFQVVQQHHVAG